MKGMAGPPCGRAASGEPEQVEDASLGDLHASLVDLRRASDLATLLQRVAVAANEASTLEAAAGVALSAINEYTGWPIGHLFVVEEPGHLHSSTTWHLAEPERAAGFVAATDDGQFAPGVGLPGQVLSHGRPIWIEDIRLDANLPRARSALEIEVVSAFAFPVVVGTEVVGVMEFFAHEQIETDEHLLSVLANVGAQLGRVVERERSERALRRNEQLTREIIETANDAFISIDSSGCVIDWNKEAETQFGWSREEVAGRLLADLIVPPEDREAHSRGIERWLEAERDSLDHDQPNCVGSVLGQRLELEAVDRNERRFPIELTAWPVRDGDTIVFNGFIHDISLRKALERDLEHRSLHDPLTGLANRTLLIDRLGQALEQTQASGTPMALLFIDLDRFKAVNDSLGHDAGDQVLVGVAERLPDALDADDTLARLSGDEFVVLRPEVSTTEEVADLASRILKQLEEPFLVMDTEAYVSASIGIVLASDASVAAETLLADADLAMYRAKERGKGVFELFDETLRIRLTERIQTERDLRRGIQAGELAAHYQPLLDLASGQVVGAEALVRWEHPRRGLLMPDTFIPMAEDTGLITRVGAWMLDEACRQMSLWQAELARPPSWVGVNLSVREIEQPGLVETIAGLLTEHGLHPAQLLLEITESAIMHDAQTMIERLWELRELGVRLAIDDFGTGFSSLDRLRRMPVDSLKVDRSFVADMFDANGGTALVAAVIAMSHSLGLGVVAEGVETVEQLDELRRLGCDEVQGYLVSRPLPPDRLTDLLRDPLLGDELTMSLNGHRPRQPTAS